MTYEQFKREVYLHVLARHIPDKEIYLLQKDHVCTEEGVLRASRMYNMKCFGKDTAEVTEDVLCAVYHKATKIRLLHWKVRVLYEKYRTEGWPGVLPQIIYKLEYAVPNGFDLRAQTNYDEISERLILRPLNYEFCKEELENCIFWRVGDIALVLYQMLNASGVDPFSAKVYREMTQGWGMSDEVILTNALINSSFKMPPRLFYNTDLKKLRPEQEGVFMTNRSCGRISISAQDILEGICGYRLTTTKYTNGALAIFYPGVKERLAKALDGDYYIGFTSVHEAVIHPVRHKCLSDMKAAILHINAVMDGRETLTNRVYQYCRSRESLVEV